MKLFDAAPVLTIVGNGMLARLDSASGKGVPVLVLDTSEHPTIDEAIRVSELEPDGDAQAGWAFDEAKRHGYLAVELIRPVPYRFVIQFRLGSDGILIDAALHAQCVMLKGGSAHDSFKSTFSSRAMALEVPGITEVPPWPRIHRRAVYKELRHRGLRRRDARLAADDAVKMLQDVSRLQLDS